MSAAHAMPVFDFQKSLEILRDTSAQALKEIKDIQINHYDRKVAAALSRIAILILEARANKIAKDKNISLASAREIEAKLAELDCVNPKTSIPNVWSKQMLILSRAYHQCLCALIADQKPFSFVNKVVNYLFSVTKEGKKTAYIMQHYLKIRMDNFEHEESQKESSTAQMSASIPLVKHVGSPCPSSAAVPAVTAVQPSPASMTAATGVQSAPGAKVSSRAQPWIK